jgi:xylan 1,4-beta-xylosidase
MFMEDIVLFYEPQLDVEQKLSSVDFHNISVRLHFHRAIELVCVHSGKVRVRNGQRAYEAGQGQIIFVPSYFAHFMESIEDNFCTNFIIPYNLYKCFEIEKIPLYYSLLSDPQRNGEIFEAIKLAKKNLAGANPPLAEGFAKVVLGLIVERYEPEEADKNDNDFIIRLIEYIDRNFTEEITLDIVAKEFGYSKYYFSKLFNRSFGCGLNYYVNQVRCNFIENEKLKGGHKMGDLILKAGFGEPSNYYKFLKKLKLSHI